MALIEKQYYWIEKESISYPNVLTSEPVEKGIDITDHVQRQARVLSVSGAVTGAGSAKKLGYLKKWSDQGIIVKYVGRNAFTGIVSGLQSDHEYTTADGFTFSFTLTEVQVAESSYTAKLPTPVKAQVVKIVNSGIKQKKSKSSKGKGKTKGKKGKGKGKGKGKSKKGKEKIEKVKFVKGSPWAT